MMQSVEDYEAHEALLAAGAVHIKMTLGTGWTEASLRQPRRSLIGSCVSWMPR